MKKSPNILIVDDEEAVCWALKRAFEKESPSVSVASSAEEAIEKMAKQPADVVFLDVNLPGMDGITALGRINEINCNAKVIVITAHGDLQTAVDAVERNAFDYLAKPFDLAQARNALRRATQEIQRDEYDTENNELQKLETTTLLVGRSPAIQNIYKRIALVAQRDTCVLITGESGTGKELVARSIHQYSRRKNGPFVPINIAALNVGLIESELFGHTKGAFTGAEQNRTGVMALASGGTLFLDELGDIPLSVQVKLLRILEHNEMTPVGGTQKQKLDIRILAATNLDLASRVAEGAFREDLFYRLNVFPIHTPPLRERREDIPLLVDFFMRQLGGESVSVPPQTMQYLKDRPWMGNVRELRNALEHALIVNRGGQLEPDHFPAFTNLWESRDGVMTLRNAVVQWFVEECEKTSEVPAQLHQKLLEVIEPALLSEIMKKLNNNRLLASQWLGLNRGTVRKKLNQYGIIEDSDEE